jgi:hypothetical protein
MVDAATELDRAKALAYVKRWFVSLCALAEQCALREADVLALIHLGAAPGIVYAREEEHRWWSALGAAMGRNASAPAPGAEHWYSPAAAWWLRRALLATRAGAPAHQAAGHNQARFAEDFIAALPEVDHAARAYPTCFEGGRVNPAEAQAMAAKEWADWVNGAYAVCMRRFSARGCIEKEALRSRIVAAMADDAPQSDQLIDIALFDLVERLEALILPFAPWERPPGSPGRAIDAPLARLGLGRETPY